MSTKKYAVTATCRVECTVEVEATSPEEARNIARGELESNHISEWSFVDGLNLTSWSEEGSGQENYL